MPVSHFSVQFMAFYRSFWPALAASSTSAFGLNLQGGCGACTVMVSYFDASSDKVIHRSVNACLAPLCSVDWCAVTTVEGIGSVKTGLHPVQGTVNWPLFCTLSVFGFEWLVGLVCRANREAARFPVWLLHARNRDGFVRFPAKSPTAHCAPAGGSY